MVLQEAFYRHGSVQAHDVAATVVHLSFFVAPHAVAAVLLLRSPGLFRRHLRATVILLLAGAAAFAFMPTAPPWLADASVTRVADVVLACIGIATNGGSAAGAEPAQLAFETNALAAMPSIHLGATILIAAIAFSTQRWRFPAAVYTCAMGLALVYLGEHHVLDVIAGAAIAAVSWRLADRLPQARTSEPRGATAAIGGRTLPGRAQVGHAKRR